MNRRSRRTSSDGSRRTFLQSTTAAAAGLTLSGRSQAAEGETLAVAGGSRSVTWPMEKQNEAERWPLYGPDEEKLVLDIMKLTVRQCYGQLARFEEAWKEYYKVPYVKATCNGTGALTSMFFALDLPVGSEILVPSYTFCASILPMRFFGLVPVFVDCDPRTGNLSVEDAARRLTKQTRAILPVHIWGLPCEMDRICAFAKEHDLIVLEDVAHAHGASMQDRKLGAWGTMAIFSFQASKPLPAMEGGAGMYQKREHYERAASLVDYKSNGTFPKESPYSRYAGTGLGLKFRMHPLGAALAHVQLRGLDQRNAAGIAQVRRLNERLLQLPGLSEPFCRPDQKRVYYDRNMLFFDESKAGFSRDVLLKALKAEGLRADAGEYALQHKYTIYSEEKWWHHKPVLPERLPGGEEVNRTCMTLPYFTTEVPELVEQYAKGFEKVWVHRKQLAKS